MCFCFSTPFRWGKSCVSLSYLLFMGSFKPPRLEENLVTVQPLVGPSPCPSSALCCLSQPLASKKMPSLSYIMMSFSPPAPHILGKAEIRECANGEKETCLLLCGRIEGGGGQVGVGQGCGGALPSREKRREGLNYSRYTNKVKTESEKQWVHFALCLTCLTSSTPACLYF